MSYSLDTMLDYALLGKLKTHFPSIPILAVTATASDRVRKDVCEILRIRHDCVLFRSTFQRPNLTYSVIPKVSKDGSVIAEMAEWIKVHHPQGAGIVYTYSRKDADTVANALCDCGVVAEV
jgi:superfamily II DNA helicase RecQ